MFDDNVLNHRFRFFTLTLCVISLAGMLISASASAQEAVSPEGVEEDEEVGSWDAEEGVNVTALFDQATELANSGDAIQALRIYKRVASVDPFWADAFYNAGVLASENGRLVDCVLYLRRYLYMRPGGDDEDDVSRRVNRCENAMGDTGILRVPLVTPPDAMVSVEGVPMAEGAIERLELPPGRYDITAERPDYKPYEAEVRVLVNETVAHEITMTSEDFYGTLNITVDQEDVTLTIDGEEVDAEAPRELLVGRYYVKAEKDGFYRWHRYVNVYRDARTNVEVRMIDEETDLEDLIEY